jgi:hypothetical protein
MSAFTPEIVLLAADLADYADWQHEYPELADTIDRVITPGTVDKLDGIPVRAVHYTDVVADHPVFSRMRVKAQFALLLHDVIEGN